MINSTMKFRLLIFLFFQIGVSNIVFSQVQSLVIDTIQSNLQVTHIYDTLWNSPPYQFMSLGVDVNNDNTNDLILSCDGYQGSSGSESEMWLKGDINTEYVLDTLVIDSTEVYGVPGNYYVVDTFQMPFKYAYGDTLSLSDNYTPGNYYIVHCFDYPPGMTGPGARLYLNDWVGGDNYVGFKTIINNIEYLGWLKVEVKFSTVIIVKECVIYNPALAVIENRLKKPLIYPNPFTTSTTLKYTLYKPAAVTISIFNPQGQLIEKIEQEQPQGEQQVQWNAEGLPAGIYYFRLSDNSRIIGSGKLLKKNQ